MKLPQSLRYTRARAGAVVAAAGAAAVLAGCGGAGDGKVAEQADLAQYFAPDSSVYLDATTDFDNPEWQQAFSVLQRFPAWGDALEKLEESLAEDDIDYATEVRPLLGGRAAIAANNLDPSADRGAVLAGDTDQVLKSDAEGDFVGAIQLEEGSTERVRDVITRDDGVTEDGEHQGLMIYTDSDSGDDRPSYAAIDGEVLLIADEREVLTAALDRQRGDADGQLAGVEKFSDGLGRLPTDTLGRMWLDIGGLISQGADIEELQAQLAISGLDAEDLTNAHAAGSLIAEDDGFRASIATLGTEGLGVEGSEFTPSLTESTPADAVAYIGFADLAVAVAQTVEAATSGPDGDQLADQLTIVESGLGAVGLTVDDLRHLTTGEHAVVLTKSDAAPIAGSLLLKVEDGARAQDSLDKARTQGAALAGLGTGQELPEFAPVDLGSGVSGWQWPLDPNFALTYGVSGDLAVVGTQPDSVRSIISPGDTLAGSADFTAASEMVPDSVTGLFWLDVDQAIPLLDAAGAFDDPDAAELKANMEPIDWVVGWSTAGDTPTSEVFVHVPENG